MEVEKVVERPYDVIVDVPKEIIREVPVPVERVVNKVVDIQVVRPHRTEIIDNIVEVEKKVVVDKVVER